MSSAAKMVTARIHRGLAKGEVWGDLAAEVDLAMTAWASGGKLEGGDAIKPGRVHRIGPAVLKAFESRGPLIGMLRGDPAWREARLARAIRSVRAPRPLAALRGPAGSLLVSEFVAGQPLLLAWKESSEARAALAVFLARMHVSLVLHGDLHHENILWTGVEWVLLDLGSLRRGAHRLFRRKLVTRQWARLIHDLIQSNSGSEEDLEKLHAGYLVSAGAAGTWLPTWDEAHAAAASYTESRKQDR